MKKITFLILFLTLSLSYGQIITYDFQGALGDEVSANSNFNDAALGVSTITRGAGLVANTNLNSFSANNWAVTSIANAVAGNDYMEFTITPNAGYEFEISTIIFDIQRSGAGFAGIALRSSIDGYATNIDGEKAIADIGGTQVISFNVSQASSAVAVTYRLYGYAETVGGTGRIEGPGDNIVIHGSISSTTGIGCNISDNFSSATIGAEWTDVGGNSSHVDERLTFVTNSSVGFDYLYQDITGTYNSYLNTLSNVISWEFNMRQNRGNPSGFNSSGYGIAFVLGASNSDLTEGNGYAVTLGQGGTDDRVRLVSYTNGLDLNGNLNPIITGATDYGNEYLSIRVTYDPATDTWELFVRDDGGSFSSPVSLGAGDSQGTVVDAAFTGTSLDYIAAVYNHGTNANATGVFDNICISTSMTCTSTVTWNGAWSGAPDSTTAVIIDAPYNTGINGGSFNACSLTVNAGNTLTIGNNDFVEVENDITVDGTIIVNPEGAVVQNNNNATVTENGLIQVVKETGFLNQWYEYTYWSSPVSGETIGGGLFESQGDRRFLFNGANFLDAFYENNNDGTQIAGGGVDDIDDNGDDWTFVGDGTVMAPGVGYAATHSQAFFFFPARYQYIFEGPFNNGIYTVPVYRNDSELNDNNWNFIGNPYPSAIDADAFLAANSIIATDVAHNAALDGAIFLWSQNTAPSSTANGNENLNFAGTDYAVINAIGQTAGGDGTTPSRFIPSGQGFFVVYSDAATPDSTVGDISQGQVIFNNSMRVTGNNDTFFRTSGNSATTSKGNENKLWLNLTSDNGVFNQILVAYAKGATNADDGMAYDTRKNLSVDASAVFYSIIDDVPHKFAIQGKEINSINKDEIIKIGYSTKIDEPTIFTISAQQFEGTFLADNPIYLKDNLLNKLHNLKESDYNFTSEIGEFNERFEIGFSDEALSLNETVINEKDLSIIEYSNGLVEFNFSGNDTMASIKIIDIQGRLVYNLNASKNKESYRLDNLNQAPYIAQVTLSSGHTITKKAIKRY